LGDRNDALDLHVVYVAWQTMSNGGEGIGEEGILVRMGVSVSVYIIYHYCNVPIIRIPLSIHMIVLRISILDPA